MLKSLPPVAHVALIALITLAVAGCNKERSYPVYRENPAPRDALPIAIRVHDAPVDTPTPKVFVTYEINPLCLPPINNYEGVQYAPQQQSVEFPVKRISDNEFTSTVFKDGMEVADYYGRGPCTWTPSLVKTSLTFVLEERRINAAASAQFQKIEDDGGSTTYVERALKPLIPGQTPERAWTLSKTMFDKRPLADHPKYFRIEISSMD
ncbi:MULTISPECIES: hypothetical protein [Stenotrophomonas]|uniref:Lipoprotein n=2 Tax=Stenotrophomonas TaxID=40323 RepID=A0A2J0UA55_STEMA|nr:MULTISPECIES: hypothetical protein [Stenotrophomonas]PJL26211.1 hypothetical protein B9Y64_16990 [Stenotrophomonas maltophilia]